MHVQNRCVREERLASEAGRENVGVNLWVCVPRDAPLRDRTCVRAATGQHALFERFGRRQTIAVDFVESAKIARQRTSFLVDAVPAQVLQQIVMRVDAVQRRVRWMRFVEIPEQVVDEMRERFEAGMCP